MRVWGNRSLGCRPASTQKRAAGFGRQTKVCSPSAAPKGDGAPIAPRYSAKAEARVSGGNQGLPALSRPSGGWRSPERFPLMPSEKADWRRAERGKAACFSANKKADSLKKPFCKRESTPLFSFLSSGLSWKRAGRIRRRPAACGKSSRRQSVSITPG